MLQPDLAGVRVLIVGARGYAAAMLRTVLNASGISRIDVVENPRRALDLLCMENIDVVLIDEHVEVSGTPFALAARRSKALLNPVVPIFAVFAGPRRRDVERSRDLGVNGVIVRPISPRTIMNKLGPALVEPRPFIAAPNFFGPDRRARTRMFGFRDRRARTPRKTRIQVLDV